MEGMPREPLRVRGKRRRSRSSSASATRKVRARATTSKEVFHFLQLPAELQNHIYDLAAEDSPSSQICPFQHQDLQQEHKLRGMGFTQVCRKIRSEFRPLWMAKTEVKIEWEHLVQYLDTFHPHRIDGPTNAYRSFTVYYNPKENNHFKNYVRILPLFRMARLSKAPKFVIDDYDDIKDSITGTQASQDLSQVLKHQNENWLRDMEEGNMPGILAKDLGGALFISILLWQPNAPDFMLATDIMDRGDRYIEGVGLSSLSTRFCHLRVRVFPMRDTET
ncbi:hypothetical protein BDV95DRAFT_572535 [Massariosphaeria phaeospora]|uniref:F-box domain-containing protein n=1 Tax=Massariosphaeria phaeospora TaxID=100035 RepID=A0A7C8M8N5_9PLEO|nr:hypothetical protein BDV95DRAFT_572535 [Massariosphaeria phaeospora]